MAKHALLSASSADKWLHCTPSAKMEATMPDTAGESAAEGTLAHEFAELKARKYFISSDKAAYTRKYNKLKANELFETDMDRYTDDYLDYLKDVAMAFNSLPYVDLETRSDYSHIVPEGFGTVDCLMICGNELNIIDFKYGKTVKVDAENNPQMLLYAAGAVRKFALLYDIKSIVLHIVQPRMENFSKWEISRDDFDKWCESIKPVAEKAFKGEGECVVGEWCDSHFCKSRANCRAYLSRMNGVIPYLGKEPPVLSDEEVGQALKLAQDIKKWYSIIEKYAVNAVLQGKHIKGWKVVEGRSNRTFDDIDKTFTDLEAKGINKTLLYKNVPITLTECEKILGKKDFAEMCGEHIIKPSGKPTLVEESDPREQFIPAAADFAGLEV